MLPNISNDLKNFTTSTVNINYLSVIATFQSSFSSTVRRAIAWTQRAIALFQVAGACWYLLAIQQVQTCLYLRCKDTHGCNTRWLGCPLPISGGYQPMNDEGWVHWGEDEYIIGSCMSSSGDYDFGIYQWAVSLVLEHTWLERIMYPIFFGIMTLRYMAEPKSNCAHYSLIPYTTDNLKSDTF